MTLQVALLGPVRAFVGDTPVAVGSPAQRAVLAALVLADGRIVAVSDLVDLLWPAGPPRTAVTKVQGHVWSLRKALGAAGDDDPAATIRTVPPGYAVDRRDLSTDVSAFDHLVARAEALAVDGELDCASQGYAQALDLIRGGVLADLPETRGRLGADDLDDRVCAALEARAEVDLRRGRARDALDALGPAMRANPFRDRVHELSIRALVELGRPADAIASYRRCRELYRDELGIEPSESLRSLVDTIGRSA
ncbi:MAG: BTAD domain-containing putative transcriptional regulator [Brevundimonas sp.]